MTYHQMLQYHQDKIGLIVSAYVCDCCMRERFDKTPKHPRDSGHESLMCDVCGHLNMGSTYPCMVHGWLELRPINEEKKP